MNCKSGAILVLALLLPALGCGVRAELPDLSFQPSDDSGEELAAPPDLETVEKVDASDDDSPDLAVTELSGPDSAPQGESCPDTMFCAIAKNCFEQADNCWDGCADGKGWQSGPTKALKVCLEKCTAGLLAEDLDKCLQGTCLDEMLECFNETPGDRTCADVLKCGIEESCDKEGQSPADSYDCFVDCFGGLREGELVEVNKVIDLCFKEEFEGLFPTVDCLAAQFDCYGGSGEKSCDAASDCLEGCYKTIICDDNDNCPERDKCTVDCIYGVSDDASKMLFEATLCSFDKGANPFECLKDDVACHLGFHTGQASCKSVMASIRQAYMGLCFPPESVPVNLMTPFLDKIKKDHADSLIAVLSCLAGEYGDYPKGCGNIPDAVWNKCVDKCDP